MNHLKSFLKKATRVIYRIPFVGLKFRKLLESARGKSTYGSAKYWNESLEGWAASYLGASLGIDLRDSITLLLARHCAPSGKSLLDVGCGGATLGLRLGSEFHTYWGLDISEVAIAKAREQLAGKKANPSLEYHLEVSRIQDFQSSRQFDLIVFNEVLYYLPIDQVEGVIDRFAHALSPGGSILISLKNDVVSRLVNTVVSRKLRFERAVLLQEVTTPGWKIVEGRETPAFLVQAFSVIK